jgi:hypothetical protein
VEGRPGKPTGNPEKGCCVRNHRIKGGSLLIAVAAVLVALSALGGTALAKRRCSLRARSALVPTLKFPCNRARVATGHNITFTVVDRNSKAHRYRPFIELSKKGPNKHGRLPNVPPTGGFYDELKPVKHHSTLFTDRPDQNSFPGWWDITPGTYYIQIQQVDDRAGIGDTFYSPVSRITVR